MIPERIIQELSNTSCPPHREARSILRTGLGNRDMPGKVLTDALVPHYAERFPISYVETYGTKNEGEPEESIPVASPRDREIYERLRALGYVR